MRKRILLIVALVLSLNSFSQSLKNRDITKLEKLGVTALHDLNSQKIKKDFSTLLKLDRKRKTNKAFGILTTTVAALSYSYGTMILITNKDEQGMSKAFSSILGGTAIGIGTINTIVSIKLFNTSKKRKRERNKLLSNYR